MSNEPLVSVCIPSYNHARFLPEAIESVLAQTYPNVELIIVDDGSTDDSLSIARQYEAKYPDLIQVHTHPNGANRGISATANLAYGFSKGKYWSGLPSDDILCKDKLEKQVKYLEANPEIGFVYSYGDYIDERSNNLPGRFGRDITGDADPLESIIRGNVIPGMSVLARREAVEKVGLHDENLIYSDWDYWLRFFAHCKGGFIPESLVEYRIHSYNTSVGIPSTLNNSHALEVYLKLQNADDEEIPGITNPAYQNIIKERVAFKQAIGALDDYFLAVDSKDYSRARAALKKALSSSPRTVITPRRVAAIIKHVVTSLANSSPDNSGESSIK